MIAAAVKPEGGPWGIALFWTDGEICKFFSVPPGAISANPAGWATRQLLFILSGKETHAWSL